MSTPGNGARTAEDRTRPWLKRARKLLSLSLAVACLVLVARVLLRQDWAAVLAAVRATEPDRLAGAGVLIALSFLALTAYDFLAIRLAGYRQPGAGLVMRTSFVGFVLAMNFGFTVLSGGAVRAWYYGRAGIPPKGVALILAHMAVTFLLGWVGLFGATLVFWPIPEFTARLGWADHAQRAIGIALLAVLAGYVGACALRLRLRLSKRSWQFPSGRLALAQVAVSLADACIAGLVLYYLLPEPGVPFLLFMRSFLSAVFVGMVSQVPGGFGVIEVTLMQLLSGTHTAGAILSTMVIYRLLNFLAPLALAGVIVAVDATRASAART